jgi:hypothetical protein
MREIYVSVREVADKKDYCCCDYIFYMKVIADSRARRVHGGLAKERLPVYQQHTETGRKKQVALRVWYRGEERITK